MLEEYTDRPDSQFWNRKYVISDNHCFFQNFSPIILLIQRLTKHKMTAIISPKLTVCVSQVLLLYLDFVTISPLVISIFIAGFVETYIFNTEDVFT